MRRRLVIILAFPIITFVFLIGWVLYCISKQEKLTKEHIKESTFVEKQTEIAADEGIEMGVIEEKITIEYIEQYEVTK